MCIYKNHDKSSNRKSKMVFRHVFMSKMFKNSDVIKVVRMVYGDNVCHARAARVLSGWGGFKVYSLATYLNWQVFSEQSH